MTVFQWDSLKLLPLDSLLDASWAIQYCSMMQDCGKTASGPLEGVLVVDHRRHR